MSRAETRLAQIEAELSRLEAEPPMTRAARAMFAGRATHTQIELLLTLPAVGGRLLAELVDKLIELDGPLPFDELTRNQQSLEVATSLLSLRKTSKDYARTERLLRELGSLDRYAPGGCGEHLPRKKGVLFSGEDDSVEGAVLAVLAIERRDRMKSALANERGFRAWKAVQPYPNVHTWTIRDDGTLDDRYGLPYKWKQPKPIPQSDQIGPNAGVKPTDNGGH